VEFIRQQIPEVVLIKPTLHTDNRGYFMETFRQNLFEKAIGYKVNFIQDNESKSAKGVLRGLHYQLPPYSQAKLVRVIEGRILDVAVDIRRGSSTFGQHITVLLTSNNKQELFIPSGFAHGFVVLSDSVAFTYKVDNYYAPEYERGIAFDDADLRIDWQLPLEELLLSDKDIKHPSLSDAVDIFE
jgi:dTDP-4-dehydrorhamnose 3,5-epimerase